jgi:hypothetical protein
MCGGMSWEPGEATDDTQMAILIADLLLERCGLDLPDILERFRRWAASAPEGIELLLTLKDSDGIACSRPLRPAVAQGLVRGWRGRPWLEGPASLLVLSDELFAKLEMELDKQGPRSARLPGPDLDARAYQDRHRPTLPQVLHPARGGRAAAPARLDLPDTGPPCHQTR